MKHSVGRTEFMVVIECCHNCSHHSWCSRHDETKYDDHYTELKRKIESEIPEVKVSKNQLPAAFKKLNARFQEDNRFLNQKTGDIVQYPRLGAFEVYSDGYLIFSKIQSNLWPCHNRMIALIYSMYHDKKNGKDLSKYCLENRIYHENDEIFKITYNRMIQKQFSEQQNWGKPSRINSSLQRSNVIASNAKLQLTPQLKKGIKIRKIASSSRKKIEPLSYSHAEISKRPQDLNHLQVGLNDKKYMGANKYIRPIQKHRKEYDQVVKARKKVDPNNDAWNNESSQQQEDNVEKHKRPSVRIIRKVIDTKIDQKKFRPQQTALQRKIPKIQPIKIFPHDTQKEHKKSQQIKSPIKQYQQDDYEQLYDQQQQKEKKKKDLQVNEYAEEFQEDDKFGENQHVGLKASNNSNKISEKIRKTQQSKLSGNVSEVIQQDVDYENLKKSENKKLKGKQQETYVQQIMEGIEESVEQDKDFIKQQNQRKEKQRLEKQKLQRQRLQKQRLQRQKLQNQRLQKQRIQKQKIQKQRIEKEQKQLQRQQLQKEIKRKQQQRIQKQRLDKQAEIQKNKQIQIQKQKQKQRQRLLQIQRQNEKRRKEQQQQLERKKQKEKQLEQLRIKDQQEQLRIQNELKEQAEKNKREKQQKERIELQNIQNERKLQEQRKQQERIKQQKHQEQLRNKEEQQRIKREQQEKQIQLKKEQQLKQLQQKEEKEREIKLKQQNLKSEQKQKYLIKEGEQPVIEQKKAEHKEEEELKHQQLLHKQNLAQNKQLQKKEETKLNEVPVEQIQSAKVILPEQVEEAMPESQKIIHIPVQKIEAEDQPNIHEKTIQNSKPEEVQQKNHEPQTEKTQLNKQGKQLKSNIQQPIIQLSNPHIHQTQKALSYADILTQRKIPIIQQIHMNWVSKCSNSQFILVQQNSLQSNKKNQTVPQQVSNKPNEQIPLIVQQQKQHQIVNQEIIKLQAKQQQKDIKPQIPIQTHTIDPENNDKIKNNNKVQSEQNIQLNQKQSSYNITESNANSKVQQKIQPQSSYWTSKINGGQYSLVNNQQPHETISYPYVQVTQKSEIKKEQHHQPTIEEQRKVESKLKQHPKVENKQSQLKSENIKIEEKVQEKEKVQQNQKIESKEHIKVSGKPQKTLYWISKNVNSVFVLEETTENNNYEFPHKQQKQSSPIIQNNIQQTKQPFVQETQKKQEIKQQQTKTQIKNQQQIPLKQQEISKQQSQPLLQVKHDTVQEQVPSQKQQEYGDKFQQQPQKQDQKIQIPPETNYYPVKVQNEVEDAYWISKINNSDFVLNRIEKDEYHSQFKVDLIQSQVQNIYHSDVHTQFKGNNELDSQKNQQIKSKNILQLVADKVAETIVEDNKSQKQIHNNQSNQYESLVHTQQSKQKEVCFDAPIKTQQSITNELMPISESNIRPIHSVYQPIAESSNQKETIFWDSKIKNGQFETTKVINQMVQTYLSNLLSPSQIVARDSSTVIQQSHVIHSHQQMTDRSNIKLQSAQSINNNVTHLQSPKHSSSNILDSSRLDEVKVSQQNVQESKIADNKVEQPKIQQQLHEPKQITVQSKIQQPTPSQIKRQEDLPQILRNLEPQSIGWKARFDDGQWVMINVSE